MVACLCRPVPAGKTKMYELCSPLSCHVRHSVSRPTGDLQADPLIIAIHVQYTRCTSHPCSRRILIAHMLSGIAALAAVFTALLLIRSYRRAARYSIKHIRGPPRKSWLLGKWLLRSRCHFVLTFNSSKETWVKSDTRRMLEIWISRGSKNMERLGDSLHNLV